MSAWLLILFITHADGTSSRTELGPFATQAQCVQRADAESLVGTERFGDRAVVGRCEER